MSYERWGHCNQVDPIPKCMFCDTFTEPTTIFHSREFFVRGWKCPKCGFTLIDSNEIQKAMQLQKEVSLNRTV